jgi:hypothetical protein
MAALSKAPYTDNVDIEQWGGLESVEKSVKQHVADSVDALKEDMSSSICSGIEGIIQSALTEVMQAIFDDDISCELQFDRPGESIVTLGFKVNNSSSQDVFLRVGMSKLIGEFISQWEGENEELAGMAAALRELADKVESSIVADDA